MLRLRRLPWVQVIHLKLLAVTVAMQRLAQTSFSLMSGGVRKHEHTWMDFLYTEKSHSYSHTTPLCFPPLNTIFLRLTDKLYI